MRARLAAVSIGTALALVGGEMAVRALGVSDLDGNFTLRNVWVRPHHLRLRTISAELAELSRHPPSYLMYDAGSGWTIRPDTRSEDGLYASNSLGIRSAPSEYTPTPAAGRLRIVLLGDSFTHGSDVAFEDTWGFELERRLREAGVDAEVLNLGVGGYGFDQTYLRWQQLGKRLAPDIVVFGFCQGDAARVVSFQWSLWHPTFAGHFTKPRFYLDGDGRLALLNSPTVPPDSIVEWLAAFPGSELARFEAGFQPRDYEDHLWLRSRLAAVTASLLAGDAAWYRDRGQLWAPGVEAGAVSAAVIEALRADVQQQGARFVTVSLPWRQDLEVAAEGRALGSDDFLARLGTASPVIRPEAALLRAAKASSMGSLFGGGGYGHYQAGTNRIIAAAVADEIRGELPQAPLEDTK